MSLLKFDANNLLVLTICKTINFANSANWFLSIQTSIVTLILVIVRFTLKGTEILEKVSDQLCILNEIHQDVVKICCLPFWWVSN